MSLLKEAMEECQMLGKITVKDALGSFTRQWVDGATFEAAIVLDNSIEAQTALAAGVAGVYTITTTRAVNLQYHEVFKRLSDGKIFRVTSDGDDKKTPLSAGLDMRQVTGEEWTLPNE